MRGFGCKAPDDVIQKIVDTFTAKKLKARRPVDAVTFERGGKKFMVGEPDVRSVAVLTGDRESDLLIQS